MNVKTTNKHPQFDYDRILDCIHCGLCLPQCPSYVVLGTEADSPRGRIFLMKSAADGKIDSYRVFKKHFDLCLACRACETACPSGVEFHSLLETAHQFIHENAPDPFFSRNIKVFFLRKIFPYPGRLRLIFRLLSFYQRLGIQYFIRKTRLLKLFSKKLHGAESFMPIITGFISRKDGQSNTEKNESPIKIYQKAGILRGCIMDFFALETNQATVRLLQKCRCSVTTPHEQHCCGAVHFHNREQELAKTFAKRTIEAFEKENVDVIITNAAGCGAMLKEYGTLLNDDSEYAERAERFSAKIRDISEFLSDHIDDFSFGPVKKSIVYDDPCHLIHGQNVSRQPRMLLEAVPELEIRSFYEPGMCCGSAGTFNISQPELSRRVLLRKMDNIKRSGAETVVTANSGCMIQLKCGAEMTGMNLKVCHIVDILDESITNA